MYKSHIKRTILFTILGAIAALIFAYTSKKIYESRIEMLLGDDTKTIGAVGNNVYTPDVMQILQAAQATGATTERQLLSSQSIFYQSLEEVMKTRGKENEAPEMFPDLYRMYDIETARNTNQTIDAGVALIKVRAFDPKVAKDIANQIAVQYNKTRLNRARQGVQNALAYLGNSTKTAEEQLRRDEKKVKDFKEQNKIADFGSQAHDAAQNSTILTQKLQNLRSEFTGASAEVASLANWQSSTPKKQPVSDFTAKSPVLQQMQSDLAALTTRRATLIAKYFEDAPEVKEVDESIAKVSAEIKKIKNAKEGYESSGTTDGMNPEHSSASAAYQTAKARKENIEKQINEVQGQLTTAQATMGTFPALEQKLAEYMRDLKLSDERYGRLKAMSDDLKNRSETAVRASLVLNTAEEDKEPISPDIKKFILIGATAGLALGLLFSFIVESLKLRIQSSTQLTALTGLPVVAAIPLGTKTGARALRLFNRPDITPPEAFRYMAFSLVTNNSKTMRTFMFTGIKSAMTTYSSALQFSLAVARAGTRVLVVDADMMKSPISRSLDGGGKLGLSNLLSSDVSTNVEEYVVSTVHPNLMLLPGGTEPSMKFLTDAPQPKLEAIMQALRLHSDVIVIAVPPCDVLADASCLAHHVDDVCLVVSAAQTNYRAVPLAQDLLNKAGAKNISIVMADASGDEEPFSKRSAYLAKGN